MTESTIMMAPDPNEKAMYPVEEAQAILRIAIAQHTEEGELTRKQLLEIAEELGIAETTLVAAEQQWQLQLRETSDLQAFDAFQKQRLQSHLVRFAIINSVLFIFNGMTAGTLSWALYIFLFWGGAIGLQTWHTYASHTEQYRRRFEKWRRREQIKQSFNRLIDWLLGVS
jgi:hypothetical protein